MKRAAARWLAAIGLMAAIGPLRAQTNPPAAAPAPAPPPTLSPVLMTEHPDVVQRFAVDGTAVRGMLDRLLLKLTSAPDIGTAWKRLGITPQDTVGIKIATAGGPLFSTHKPIVQAICDGLEAAGLPPSHIIIWDKEADTLRRAGYALAPPGDQDVGVEAVFPGTGYDPDQIYKNEIVGQLIWGDYEFAQGGDDLFQAARDAVSRDPLYGGGRSWTGDPSGAMATKSNKSYYARLVTRTCTKIINVPVLSDNPGIGLNGCLGSLALACVDNNRRFQFDPTYGDPAVCEILDRDFIRRKVVVHILDALVSEYAGGPQFDPQFTVATGALYVSRDPVAIDWLVLPKIEAWRKRSNIDPIGKAANHIRSAPYYNLGTADPRRIQFIQIP